MLILATIKTKYAFYKNQLGGGDKLSKPYLSICHVEEYLGPMIDKPINII